MNALRHHAEQLLLAKAVKQDRLGWPLGNCLEACYATLLGVPLDAVPDPRDEATSRLDAERRIRARGIALQEWLHHTFTLCAVSGKGEKPPGVIIGVQDVPLFWIASGLSERGLQHATVYSNTQLIWDPHPSDAGLLNVTRWTVLAPIGPLWHRIKPLETESTPCTPS